jgi:hypothetical protein
VARPLLDPKHLTEFVQANTEYVASGFPRRERRFINGRPLLDRDTDARVLRRWATSSGGVRPKAAERLLGRYGLTLADFEHHINHPN